jgi:sulfite reductase alpha subunit-like flavoprotein
MATPELFLLYGSQTGNGESIAKEVSELLSEKSIENKLMTLNAFKSVTAPSNGNQNLLVIICSTTGNGNCPENADAWWRSVKLRSAVSPMFPD